MKTKFLRNSKAALFGTVIILAVLLALLSISFGAGSKTANAADSEIIYDSEDSNEVTATIDKFAKPTIGIANNCLVFTPGATFGGMYRIYFYSDIQRTNVLFTIDKPISEDTIPLNKEFFDAYGYPERPKSILF